MTNVKFKHCILTLQDELSTTKETFRTITNSGFKILSVEPFKIEGELVTKEKICELTDTLQKCLDLQEADGFVRVEESPSGNFKCSENDYPFDKTSSGAEADLKRGIGKSVDSSELASSHNLPARSTASIDERQAFSTAEKKKASVGNHEGRLQDCGKGKLAHHQQRADLNRNAPKEEEAKYPDELKPTHPKKETQNKAKLRTKSRKSSNVTKHHDVDEVFLMKTDDNNEHENEQRDIGLINDKQSVSKEVGGKQCNRTVCNDMEKSANQTKKRVDEGEETSYCESLENSYKSEATQNFALKENSSSENGKHFNDVRDIARGLPEEQDEDMAADSNVKCDSIKQQQSTYMSKSATAGPTEIPKTNAQMRVELNRNNANMREGVHCRPYSDENVSPRVGQIGIHSSGDNRRTVDVSQTRPGTNNFDGITNSKDSTSQSTGTKDEGKEESGERQALNFVKKEKGFIRTHEGRQKECSQAKLVQQPQTEDFNRNKQGEERNGSTESLDSSPKSPETIKESENNKENYPDTAKKETDDEEELMDNIHREKRWGSEIQTDNEKYKGKTTNMSHSEETNDEEQAVKRYYGHLGEENNTHFAMMQDQEGQQADITSDTWTNKLSSGYEDLNYNSHALNSLAKVEDQLRNHQSREQNYTQTKRVQTRKENSADDHSTRGHDRKHGHEYRPENITGSPANEETGAFPCGFHNEEGAYSDTWNRSGLEDYDHAESEDNHVEISLKRERLKLALRYLGLTGKEEYMHIEHDTDPVKVLINVNLDDGKKFQNDLKKVKFVVLPFQRDKIEYAEIGKILERWSQKILVTDNKVLIAGLKDDIETTEESVTKFLRKSEGATSKSIPLDKDIQSSSQRIDTETNAGNRNSPADKIKQDLGARPKEQNLLSKRITAATSGRAQEEVKAQHAVRRSGNTYTGHNSELVIHIEKEDITKMKVDAIVNAANRHLRHGSGVARAISLAAGYRLNNACLDFISKNGTLSVTEVFVSPGGGLPVKHVLHAVGPKWKDYPNKYQCEQELRKTILQCLTEASKLGASTLALPSVSAANFKVPHDICARSYMEAVKHFDEWKKHNLCSLNEIYFVDLNDIMVNHIIECFKKKWDQQCVCSPETKRAELIPSSQQWHLHPGSSTVSQPARYSDTYRIGNVGLHVSRKCTMDIKADVVVVIGGLFSKMSGLSFFEAQKNFKIADSLPAIRDKFRFGYLSKPNGSSSRLICEVKLKSHDLEQSFKYLKTVPQNMKNCTFAGPPIAHIVITSELLYCNAKDTKKDRKNNGLVSKFSGEVYQWLSEISTSRQNGLPSLSTVTITADKDYLPLIQRVFESQKNVNRDVEPTSPDRRSHSRALSDVSLSSSRGPGQRTDSSREGDMSHRQSRSDIHHSSSPEPREERDLSSEGTGLGPSRMDQSDEGQPFSHGPGQSRDSRMEMEEADHRPYSMSENDENQPFLNGPGLSRDSRMEMEDCKSHWKAQNDVHHSSSQILEERKYTSLEGASWNSHRADQSDVRHLSSHSPGERGYSSLEDYKSHSGGQSVVHHSSSHEPEKGRDSSLEDTDISDDLRPECTICYDNRTDFITPCCKTSICSDCKEKTKKGLCPFCRKVQGIIYGDQPDGTMFVSYCCDSADGYEGHRSWKIEYYIRGGFQKETHPNPGKWCNSLFRTAYLPDTDTGRHVLKMLRIAFNRKLIFTIGTSLTRQKDDVLIWNDIHHKTNLHGGSHGYPDPTYLDNVMGELANKGVDPQNITDKEHKDLEDFSRELELKSTRYDYRPRKI